MVKPQIFVSCGQRTPEERQLAAEICEAIQKHGVYDHFFAEFQHNLHGLNENILEALARTAGFVTVLHGRGAVTYDNKDETAIVRASVWIEQEIAIAAFIQSTAKRSLLTAAYIEKGVGREGIRDLLHLNPIEFSSNGEVLDDLQRKLDSWQIPNQQQDSSEQVVNSNYSSAEQTQNNLRRQSEARRLLAAELQRTIDRVLYIHGRALANFICYSADTNVKPTDLKQDFIPHWPSLYPTAPQVRDLAEDDAAALIAYYDSLQSLNDDVNDWWGREGQLPTNLFNGFLHKASKCLRLALICIEKFELEALIPPPYESWGTISSRINQALKSEEQARKAHLARAEAKAGS